MKIRVASWRIEMLDAEIAQLVLPALMSTDGAVY